MARELLPDEVYFATQPKKSCSAGVLLFDGEGRLLLVDPYYKPHWILPGGMVDADESPRVAALREVREEVGLSIDAIRLLAIDCYPADPPRPEHLHFLFDGGALMDEQIDAIRIQEDELDGFRFVSVEEIPDFMNPRMTGVLQYCLLARARGEIAWLEQGAPVGL